MSSTQIYDNANQALVTLSNLWQTMLQIIQTVSDASASSLTVEPDLVQLQKTRKEYEQLVSSLKTTLTWLEANQLKQVESINSPDLQESIQEHEQLQEKSFIVSNKLKRMLNQSYALQFQLEMLFTSSQDISLS
ncbi:hypothetical protein EDC94DRAFT_663118 [Helicostylum pulchrum]|uniref:Uncharacterized protein n=1 Tax=Helicostylum pulchrum TaxID=562976 RepID=A0ABP9YI68_9FUNG|nr:hypothetical protein EDC94DRAFT_663118 [Helicostylum pulchrum]